MSTLPDNEFDLEKLFLPAWAQEESSATKYAKYEGREDRSEGRGDRRGFRPPRRDGPGGPRREGSRPQDRRGPANRDGGAPRGGAGGRDNRGERRGPQSGFPHERREAPAPLPELEVSLVPEEKGVESLARQIKMTGRAYPLFDIAQMILQKPERHTVTFAVRKNPEGQPIQPLFVCALDDSLWLSEEEAVGHVLRKHFATFYQSERTATEPPKGKYTFVAQCGMSGVVLGPPNYHDYQNQLWKLHAERFARMPFEVYKARVKIVRDEEVVKKWVEDQSFKTEFLCLNMPEPLRLADMEAVEKHFREQHKANIIKPVDSYTVSGTAARAARSPELARLVRAVWEDQRRFPLQIATVLSQQFAGHGLQFFKVNKTITHVSVARPHYLDMTLTPVSGGVQSIVDYINAHPKCSRRQLIETLSPSPPPAPIPVPSEGQPAPAPSASTPTPEQNALIGDLHWLIHQGHVIEFANGTLETAKKPLPRPPKPAPKAEAKPADASSQTATPATSEAAPIEAPVGEAPPSSESSPAVEPPQAESTSPPPASQPEPTASPKAETAGATATEADEHQAHSTPETSTNAAVPAEAPAAPVESQP